MNVPYFEITAICDNDRCQVTEFKGQRKQVEKTNTAGGTYTIDRLVCGNCRSWGKVTKIEKITSLRCGDGEAVELGDQIEVNDDPKCEPERATVIQVGKGKIRIKWSCQFIKPQTQYVDPALCELLRREG